MTTGNQETQLVDKQTIMGKDTHNLKRKSGPEATERSKVARRIDFDVEQGPSGSNNNANLTEQQITIATKRGARDFAKVIPNRFKRKWT